MKRIQGNVAAIALNLAFVVFCCACSTGPSAHDAAGGAAEAPSFLMADGKRWTANVNINTPSSYCYDDAQANCERYGRLYTWESAQRVCQLLGAGWHLPTDEEWRGLAKPYGGVGEDSADDGKAAYTALIRGGPSGFNAVFGGNRSDEQYARLEAHGFYWTASDNGPNTAPFYNFGKNGQALHRQPEGQKQMAISVACVAE
jgi:uncharacterized protein (TIGR02145 family)